MYGDGNSPEEDIVMVQNEKKLRAEQVDYLELLITRDGSMPKKHVNY